MPQRLKPRPFCARFARLKPGASTVVQTSVSANEKPERCNAYHKGDGHLSKAFVKRFFEMAFAKTQFHWERL